MRSIIKVIIINMNKIYEIILTFYTFIYLFILTENF